MPRNPNANFQKRQEKQRGEGSRKPFSPRAAGDSPVGGFWAGLKAVRFQQLVRFKPKSMRNLLQRQQTGIRLNPKLVKLIKLVADTAGFGSLLLCPTAPPPQFAKPFAESC